MDDLAFLTTLDDIELRFPTNGDPVATLTFVQVIVRILSHLPPNLCSVGFFSVLISPAQSSTHIIILLSPNRILAPLHLSVIFANVRRITSSRILVGMLMPLYSRKVVNY